MNPLRACIPELKYNAKRKKKKLRCITGDKGKKMREEQDRKSEQKKEEKGSETRGERDVRGRT